MIKLLKHPLAKKIAFNTTALIVGAIILHQLRTKTTGLVDDD